MPYCSYFLIYPSDRFIPFSYLLQSCYLMMELSRTADISLYMGTHVGGISGRQLNNCLILGSLSLKVMRWTDLNDSDNTNELLI